MMTVKHIPREADGDRPRSGGLVESSLFSNIARRLRTPPDILATSQKSLLKGMKRMDADEVVRSCPEVPLQ